MTKNLTLRLDEAIVKDAKRAAVEADKSLSRWVADLIQQAVSQDVAYERAKKRAAMRMKRGFHLGGKPFARESLHER